MKSRLVDLLGWTAILFWLVLSGHYAMVHDAEMFQAVGVVGISAAVGYFVLQRHATPHPVGAIESNALLQKQVIQASDGAGRALAYTALLARAMLKDAEDNGRKIPLTIHRLASVSDDHIESIISPEQNSYEQQVEKVRTLQLDANDQVNRTRRSSELFQAFVVILGTLQSGLGATILIAISGGAN